MNNNQQIEQMMSKMKAAMMVEIKEKVQDMRAEKDREMEEMREEMQKKVDVMRKEMREDFREEMTEEMEAKENLMKKQLDGLEVRNTELTTKLKEVDQKSTRDLPYVITCAYQDVWTTLSATITYDRLTMDYNNSGRPGGGDARMDISTGKFTILMPGHYTVTYSGRARVDPGEMVTFQLMKNGVSVGREGEWESYCSSGNGGLIRDEGSRTVVSV